MNKAYLAILGLVLSSIALFLLTDPSIGGGWLEANTCPGGACYQECPIAYEESSSGYCMGDWKCCTPLNQSEVETLDLDAMCFERGGECIDKQDAIEGTKFLGGCDNDLTCAIIPEETTTPDEPPTGGGGGEETHLEKMYFMFIVIGFLLAVVAILKINKRI